MTRHLQNTFVEPIPIPSGLQQHLKNYIGEINRTADIVNDAMSLYVKNIHTPNIPEPVRKQAGQVYFKLHRLHQDSLDSAFCKVFGIVVRISYYKISV